MALRHRRLPSTAIAGAVALALASPAAAAEPPRVIEPTRAGLITGLATEDAATLFSHRQSLLRADGSFGLFSSRTSVPHERLPMELVTYDGPVASGQLRRQEVVGAPGGTAPYALAPASGVAGYDWVFDDAPWRLAKPGETPQSPEGWVDSEPSLIAVDDLGRAVQRTPLDVDPRLEPKLLVATGRGLRVFAYSRTTNDMQVLRSSGRRFGSIAVLSAIRFAIGRADGSMLFAGDPAAGRNMSDAARERLARALVRMDAKGKVSRVRDAQGRVVEGDPLTEVRGGVLLTEPSDVDEPERPRRTIQVLSDSGRTTRRALATLDLPWSPSCRAGGTVRLDWAMAGTGGQPVLGVTCFAGEGRTFADLGSFVVGLDTNLRARWVVDTSGTVSPDRVQPVAGADGQLYAGRSVSGTPTSSDFELIAWREPGAGRPRLGRVVSVDADGAGAVVTIRCAAPTGSICSGTVRLRRDGGTEAASLPYALQGRPGRDAAVIKRHFATPPAGSGALRATLSP